MPARQTISAVNATILGEELKAIRRSHALTLHDAGRGAKIDPGRLSKIENALIGVNLKELIRLVDFYEVGASEREHLISYVTEDRVEAYWAAPRYKDLRIGTDLAAKMALEREDDLLIQDYSDKYFSLFLQEQDYARRVIELSFEEPNPAQVDLWLELRHERQKALSRQESPVQLHTVFDESCLHRVKEPAELRAQLRHVVEMAQLDNVTVQMAPFTAGLAGMLVTSAQRYVCGGRPGPRFVFTDNMTAITVRESEHDDALFRAAFARITSVALSPDETVTVLEDRLKEIG